MPPPTNNFRKAYVTPTNYISSEREFIGESESFKYLQNILISRFYEQFSRSSRNLGHFWKFEKISNSQNTNISYVILKCVIWRFQIYNLFREKFKFLVFAYVRISPEYIIAFIFAKFKYFTKQIIYLESPDHALQNDI